MQQIQSNVCIANYDYSNENIRFQITEQSQSNSKCNYNVKVQIILQEESLVTHLILKPLDNNVLKGFQLHNLESIEMLDDTNNQTYNKLLNCKDLINQDIKIYGLAITKKLRLNFSFIDLLDKETPKNSEYKSIEYRFKKQFPSLTVYGYQFYQTPAANQMVTLLNISHIFKRNQKELNGAEADILLGLSLLSSRRFIQASEIFKKVAYYFAEKAQLLKKKEQYYYRASSLQILVADSINQPSMLSEKLQALKQAVVYLNHMQHQENEINQQQGTFFTLHNPDSYECIMKLSDDLIKIISKALLLENNFDALRMANLRCLEFIIEQLGCSLGSQLIQILKLILKLNSRPQPTLVVEMLHKIINLILSELSQGTLKFIQSIWSQIVINELFDQTPENQRLIMTICECLLSAEYAYFKIDTAFLKQLNQLEEDKIWNLVLQQIIPKQNDKKLVKITNWINDQLNEQINFCQYNSLSQINKSQIMKLLQLSQTIIKCNSKDSQIPFFEEIMNQKLTNNLRISNLYFRPNSSIINLKPILLKLLEQTVNGKIDLQCFQLVWSILIDVILYYNNSFQIQLELGEYEQIYELINLFLTNIFSVCKVISPQQDMLTLLQLILSTVNKLWEPLKFRIKDQLYNYMEIFCQRVPHSIYDETFQIFNYLLDFIYEQLDKSLIDKCVMALIDQYTVKGQAQKQSKQYLIKLLLQNPQHTFSFIQICLITNQEPELLVNHSKVKDIKLIYQEYELFQEKLQFASELFAELAQNFKILFNYLQNSQELRYMLSTLLQSHNSKIRFKIFSILQYMVEGFITYNQNTKQKGSDEQLGFVESISSIILPILSNKNDSKCLLNALVLINSLFSIKFQRSDYARLLKLIILLWPYIAELVDCPHNGIYSISFELLNIWAQLLNKIQNIFEKYDEFIEYIFSWAQEQLEGSESWHQYNILKICGYIFGLDQGKNFRKFQIISQTFWESIYPLQVHHNRQLQLMAIVIIQLCSNEQLAMKMIQQNAEQYLISRNKQSKVKDQIKKQSEQLINSLFLRQSNNNLLQSETQVSFDDSELNQEELLWMRKIQPDQLQNFLQSLFTYQPQQESKIKQSDIGEKEFSIKQSNNDKNMFDDDPLDFDELGIIEVDDEEWNEYDDLRKIPILKEKIKQPSPHIVNSGNNYKQQNKASQQERILSGNKNKQLNEQQAERKQDKLVDDQVLKTLRPHNQVFRPLTPPIGQTHQQFNEIQSDMKILSDFVLQNPQEFQKLMQEIKISNNQIEQQKEKKDIQQQQQSQQQQQQQQQQQFQQQQKRQNLAQFQEEKNYEDDSNQHLFIDSSRRKVDELEFDPQFSNSSQDEAPDQDQFKSLPLKQQATKKKNKKGIKRTSSDTDKLISKKELRQSSLGKSQPKPFSSSDEKWKQKKGSKVRQNK